MRPEPLTKKRQGQNSRMRPLIRPPGKRDASTGLDARRNSTRRAVLVAVDIGRGIRIWGDEADIEVLGVPACDVGEGAGVLLEVVVVDWMIGLVMEKGKRDVYMLLDVCLYVCIYMHV